MTGSPDKLFSALTNRYRLDRELGAGGMATVYLAEDLKHHRGKRFLMLRGGATDAGRLNAIFNWRPPAAATTTP